MNLNADQKRSLKTYIDASEFAGTPNNPDQNAVIADALNMPAVPAYWAWRSKMDPVEWLSTTFDMIRLAALSPAEVLVWRTLTGFPFLNMGQAAVRAGIEYTFSTSDLDMPTRQAIYNASQRTVSRAEKVFATGAGKMSDHHGGGPSTLLVEGTLTYQDVADARNII
jgi:hypothetical protein